MNNDIRFQINNYDTYQTSPQEIDNLYQEALQVPIIRIYGALVFKHNNEKKCFNTLIHVHNYFPYLYLSCDYAFIKSQLNHLAHVTNYLESFIHSLVTKSNKTLGKKRNYIANISLCKGIPIYGYRVGYQLFYKINFLSPNYKSRFTNSIDKLSMDNFSKSPNFKFQVFESHIPFTSQFLQDFNLYSCDWINISHCYFRLPIIQNLDEPQLLKDYLSPHIKNNLVNYTRMGYSTLEIDIKTNYIINANLVSQNLIHHDFNLFAEETINLSSLTSILKDLDFQSNLNNLNFEFSDDFSNLIQGSTIWSNSLDLNKLLSYAVTLTKSFNQDLSAYKSRVIDPINKDYEHYPTIFETVAIEKREVSKVVFDLVIPNQIWSQSQSLISPQNDFDMSDSYPVEESDKNGLDDFDNGSEDSESDEEKVNDSEDELDNQSEEEKEGPLAMGSDDPFSSQIKEGDYSRIDDSQIFTQYQKPVPTLVDNSFSKEHIIKDLENNKIIKINYPDPYYDREQDISKPLIFANKRIKVPFKQDIPHLTIEGIAVSKNLREGLPEITDFRDVEYSAPPSKQEVIDSYHEDIEDQQKYQKFKSQLDSMTSNYKISINDKIDRSPNDFVQLTNFIMELHINTTTNKLPDPTKNEISIMFFKFDDSNGCFPKEKKSGYIVNKSHYNHGFPGNHSGILVGNELEMMKELIKLIRKFDPDILSGFEINSHSWGYLIARSRELGDDITPELSKTSHRNNGKVGDRWGYTHTSTISIVGRYTLNIWRVLRRELTLNNYSFENCCYHVLHSTFPKLLNLELTKFLKSFKFENFLVGINYYLKKVAIIDYFINSQELITKNTESSRLIGIDFNSNFYRGSQFKVESILLRFAKLENVLLNSPTKLQVHKMRALEQIPLIMEPESNFYKSPLLVLDFQSLYPSIMIAYNYCYSTILCKLHGFNPHKNNLGYLNHVPLHPFLIDVLNKQGCLNISPNGYVFVNQKFRKSILSKMLSEILTMRINIKRFLNTFKKEDYPQLYKVFNSRQMALKLIANVTYGYASATYSGRMPNSDIADAIVSTGREILTQSIDMIEQSGFGAKVVYGDTDSLFVYLPGKSLPDAFEIGEILAKKITEKFPDPIKLKFEKVYHPCVLLSKKRYVGYSYEYLGQQVKFDAKGIETIRRDGIPAQQKILEKALRILFDTSNLSEVKKYVQDQFRKILDNKILISDFCFAKEVRYGTYKNEKYLPPGAIVARKKIEQDSMNEPQYRERVPYVVIRDPTKHRLKDRCISPEEFIENSNYKLDYEYYITKVLIPPLERIFNLMGCDIQQWYREIPKMLYEDEVKVFMKSTCLNCGDASITPICTKCNDQKYQTILTNKSKVRSVQVKLNDSVKICNNCIERNLQVSNKISNLCINQDCTNYYHKFKLLNEIKQVETKTNNILNNI